MTAPDCIRYAYIKLSPSLKMWAGLMMAAHLVGCTRLAVTVPANGSTVRLPQDITVTEWVGLDGATQGPRTILVDGVDAQHFKGYTVLYPTLCCLDSGAHSIFLSDRTSWKTLTFTSNFTVDANSCPSCYSCPSGSVHPVFGLCCDNGSCDAPASSNFGPWRFNAAECPSLQAKSNDCLNQNAQAICGPNGAGCANVVPMATQMLAVSFRSIGSGALKQIQVPIGWRSGGNAFQVWVTADNGGKPGAILETFSLANIRNWTFPTSSAMHIFSVAHPQIVQGTTYWLVIGPAAQDTVGSWNLSLADPPTAGSTDFLVNTTANASGIPQLVGPWTPAGGPLRPAFQIDIR